MNRATDKNCSQDKYLVQKEFFLFDFELFIDGIEHYHHERSHQSLENKIIDHPPDGKGEIVCQERLGGLFTRSYRANIRQHVRFCSFTT
jgi:hypothetical protein